MFSHTKSILALGLAALLVAGAGLWLRHQAGLVASLAKEKINIERQASERNQNLTLAHDLEQCLSILQTNICAITQRFSEKDSTGPRLVTVVVKTASSSGLETISTAERSLRPKSGQPVNASSLAISTVSYEFVLKGAYRDLVRLLQNLEADKLAHRIESLEISCPEHLVPKEHVQASLVISVFACDKQKMPGGG